MKTNQNFELKLDNSQLNNAVVESVKNLINENGNYRLKVMSVEQTHSFEVNGVLKEGIMDAIKKGNKWATPVMQFKVVLVDATDADKGAITVRFGYVGHKHETDEKFNRKEYADKRKFKFIEGYLCTVNEDGYWDRVIDEGKSAKARRFTNTFLNALGYPTGNAWENLQDAAAKHAECIAEVYMDEYQGKQYAKVKDWHTVGESEKYLHDAIATADDFLG